MIQTVYFIDRRLVSIAGTVTLVNKKFGNNEMLIILNIMPNKNPRPPQSPASDIFWK